VAANYDLGSDAASYSINSVNMVEDSIAEVNLTVSLPDGSSSERFTRFIVENGSWEHDLTQEEYDLFSSAADTPASASASASGSASADSNTKHVEIVITSNRPADVSIYDDSFNWVLNEEIVGTETYERDIPENSGLSVSAITAAYHAQTTIEVYEVLAVYVPSTAGSEAAAEVDSVRYEGGDHRARSPVCRAASSAASRPRFPRRGGRLRPARRASGRPPSP
jgi:hypothetical protein